MSCFESTRPGRWPPLSSRRKSWAEYRPDFVAFLDEAALPDSVRGPVEQFCVASMVVMVLDVLSFRGKRISARFPVRRYTMGQAISGQKRSDLLIMREIE